MPELIDGAKVRMGGKEWIVPALSFRQLKKLLPKINMLNIGELTVETMDSITEVVHAAISRNYPELSVDDVADMLDVRAAPAVFMAIMGESGLEATSQGEAPEGGR